MSKAHDIVGQFQTAEAKFPAVSWENGNAGIKLLLQSGQNQALRLCVACRKKQAQASLFRLTVDKATGEIFLNLCGQKKKHREGRSAYLCPKESCLGVALQGNKLKTYLEGRKKNTKVSKGRQIQWPLEPQLIRSLRLMCTENQESCHNTQKEGI